MAQSRCFTTEVWLRGLKLRTYNPANTATFQGTQCSVGSNPTTSANNPHDHLAVRESGVNP